MKKSRFTENQIIAILKEGETGVQVRPCQRPSNHLCHRTTPFSNIGRRQRLVCHFHLIAANS